MIRGTDVNEAWYAHSYEDIGEPIRDGVIRSAKQHFITGPVLSERFRAERQAATIRRNVH
jgi:hypothetical protein